MEFFSGFFRGYKSKAFFFSTEYSSSLIKPSSNNSLYSFNWSFVELFFGDDFKIWVVSLIYLTLAKTINATSGSVGNLLQMTGYQKIFMKILFFGAILNICLNFILIPKYGIDGAALMNAYMKEIEATGHKFPVRYKIGG